MKREKVPFGVFLDKANSAHNSEYTYIEDSYNGISGKVTIVCSKHGEFTRYAYGHVKGGSRCPMCYRRKPSDSCEKYKERCKRYKHANVYLLKMTSHDEGFYKIGVSVKNPMNRIPQNHYYDSEVLGIICLDPKFAFEKEQNLHNTLTAYRYKPNQLFLGATECYQDLPSNVLEQFGVYE